MERRGSPYLILGTFASYHDGMNGPASGCRGRDRACFPHGRGARRLALAIAIVVSAPAGASAAGGAAAAVSGLLSDRASGDPLAGVTVRLGPGRRAVTDARGRFRFAGVATGVYRVIVTGACDQVPLRVEVRPGEERDIAVAVSRDCPEDERILEAEHVPAINGDPWPSMPAPRRQLWQAALYERRPGVPLDCEGWGSALSDLVEDGTLGRQIVVAGRALDDCDIGTLASGAEPAAAAGDWLGLIDADCFARQLVLTARGELRVQLIESREEGVEIWPPLLHRTLCIGCVREFFRELSALDLPDITGIYAGSDDGPFPSRTIAGVVGGKPFLVRTEHLRLATVEAVRTFLLDLCAYRGCVDPAELERFPAEVRIEAPAAVAPGERFTVGARVTVPSDVEVSGAVIWLDTGPAGHIRGERGAGGVLAADSPLAVEVEMLAPLRVQNDAESFDISLRLAAENALPLDPALRAAQVRTIQLRRQN